MPSFLYTCQCGANRYFRDPDIGREETCAKCHALFVVRKSSPESSPTVTNPDRRDTDTERENHVKHAEEIPGDKNENTSVSDIAPVDPSRIRYTCEQCGKTTDYPRSLSGTTRHCLACKSLITLPGEILTPETFRLHKGNRDRIGRYELKEYLGEGGMGVLRIARDTQLRRLVALKQIHSRFCDQKRELARRRMIREAIVTAGLMHPNIIPIHTLEYDDNEDPFYTMPLLEGSNLKFKILKYHEKKADKTALRVLLRHFSAICRAVGYAHDRRILHRDIKPTNIHFDGFGNPVLIDWGLAKHLSDPIDAVLSGGREETESQDIEESEEEFGSDLTLDGRLVGTRRFWAPEYRRTRTSAISNDIYALGIVFYYILCGSYPYTNEEIAAGAQHHLPSGDKHPTKINLAVDHGLANICLKCLYHDLDKRMPDAKMLAAAVDFWIDK